MAVAISGLKSSLKLMHGLVPSRYVRHSLMCPQLDVSDKNDQKTPDMSDKARFVRQKPQDMSDKK